MNGSVNIPTKNFYSAATKKEYFHYLQKKKKKKKTRSEREAEYKQRPLANIRQYCDSCFSEPCVWQWFPRQQEALDFCTVSKKDRSLCVFSQEKVDGKRRYLVTTRKQFWSKYKYMAASTRHFYEVMRLDDPCRLYFDIEFQREFNNRTIYKDGCKELMQTFIWYISYCLYKEFGLASGPRDVVDLCSSTSSKFSRHLVFHLGKAAFLNNIHCGEFVKDACKCLKEYLDTRTSNKFLPVVADFVFLVVCDDDDVNTNIGGQQGEENLPPPTTTTATLDDIRQQWAHNLTPVKLNNLMVNAGSERQTSFLCDLAVYTKNRNFRLYLSSKVSKHIPLEISPVNEFCFKTKISSKEKYFNYQMRNTNFDPEFEKFADTMVCPDPRKVANLLTYRGPNEGGKLKKYLYPSEHSNVNLNLQTGTTQSSIFPELDVFVISIVNRFGPKGHIRRWLYFETRQTMIYDIGDNRWCGNVQRQHKSNHVYYVADLKCNVVHQKCHDPECTDYRSPEVSIPRGINPHELLEDNIDDFEFSYDEELNQLLEADFPWDDCKQSDLNSSLQKKCSTVPERSTGRPLQIIKSSMLSLGSTGNNVEKLADNTLDVQNAFNDLSDILLPDEEEDFFLFEDDMLSSPYSSKFKQFTPALQCPQSKTSSEGGKESSKTTERPVIMAETPVIRNDSPNKKTMEELGLFPSENQFITERPTLTSDCQGLTTATTTTTTTTKATTQTTPTDFDSTADELFINQDINTGSFMDDLPLFANDDDDDDDDDENGLLCDGWGKEGNYCQNISMVLFEETRVPEVSHEVSCVSTTTKRDSEVVVASKPEHSNGDLCRNELLVELLDEDLDDDAFLQL